MFFNLSPPRLTFLPIVAYMKNSPGQQFDRDVLVLDKALAQFGTSFSLVVERDNETGKLADLLGATIMKKVTTVVIPDFSHLGFYRADWSSALGDLFTLKESRVHLISVRDGFDSKKDSARDAIAIICENIKADEAA